VSLLTSNHCCIGAFAFSPFGFAGLLLQDHISVDALFEDSTLRDSCTPLVRSARMASHSDMLDLLAILAKCDEYESCNSCCTSDCPPTFSPPLWSSDCCHEVDSGVVDTLY
jgi:hypothetical protein